jgi:hypothetical protein
VNPTSVNPTTGMARFSRKDNPIHLVPRFFFIWPENSLSKYGLKRGRFWQAKKQYRAGYPQGKIRFGQTRPVPDSLLFMGN